MSEEEVKTLSTPGHVLGHVIFEQVANGCFTIYDRAEGKFYALDNPKVFFHEGLEYVPLERLPWPSASMPKEYGSPEQLFNEIRAFFVEHLDVANELLYDVYACFVLASWRSEDFKVVPYLFFLGPLASGKTRALECFHRLCYRSIMAASMSAASLFRALEQWHPTLLLDETEIYGKEAMVEVLALLNSGYRRGQYAIRIEKLKEEIPQIGFFDVFGFKVLAGTEELAATLQSRCIITTMSKAVRSINLFIDEDKALGLRNKLLMYRFKNLGKIGESEALQQFFKLNGYFQNARVIELFISLLEVAPTQQVKERLLTCMKGIIHTRLSEEQASIEARVFDAILKCEAQVEDGKISTQAITEAFNQGLPEKEQVKSRFIGRKVVSLGFEKCRVGNSGQAGYFWDAKLIERLKKRYYPPSKLTSETSETSETSASMENEALRAQESAEVTEEITSVKDKPTGPLKPINAEVSEQTEVSEVNLEGIALKDLKSVYWAEGFFGSHICGICKLTKLTSWRAETFKGYEIWICEDCKDKWEKHIKA